MLSGDINAGFRGGSRHVRAIVNGGAILIVYSSTTNSIVVLENIIEAIYLPP